MQPADFATSTALGSIGSADPVERAKGLRATLARTEAQAATLRADLEAVEAETRAKAEATLAGQADANAADLEARSKAEGGKKPPKNK